MPTLRARSNRYRVLQWLATRNLSTMSLYQVAKEMFMTRTTARNALLSLTSRGLVNYDLGSSEPGYHITALGRTALEEHADG